MEINLLPSRQCQMLLNDIVSECVRVCVGVAEWMNVAGTSEWERSNTYTCTIEEE